MPTQLPNSFANSSLSHATMRDIDLYEAFMYFLDSRAPKLAKEIRKQYKDVITGLEKEGNHVGVAYVKDSEYLIEALFDALNEIAPEGCYFGASEGDGSDYGFWQVESEYVE